MIIGHILTKNEPYRTMNNALVQNIRGWNVENIRGWNVVFWSFNWYVVAIPITQSADRA